MLYAIFAVLVIILDQGVKYWVAGHVALNLQTVPLIPDVLSIVNIRNDGAAFGFLAGSNARIYFIILTGAFTLAVILMLATKFISGPLARWSIVLVTAGGLSNCIDRVIYGYVQDMFKCEFINFPVFNVADIFITVFALLFVLAILLERDRRKEDYDFDEDYDEDEDYDDEEEEEEERPRRLGLRGKRGRRRAEEDYDDEEDEDEEDERPARRGLSGRRAGRKAARYDEEYDDGEDEDEEDERPARRAAKSRPAPRKAPRYDDEEDEDEEEEPAPRRRESPFGRKHTSKYAAEYESIKARKQANAAPQRYEVAAAPVDLDKLSASRPSAPIAPPPPAPEPAAAPAPRPAAPAKKESVSSEMEFSLDDILAEFK